MNGSIAQMSVDELELSLDRIAVELHEIQTELARRAVERLTPAERRAQLRVVIGGAA